MNAENLFKQCLFKIEIQQACEVNKKAIKLSQQKEDAEMRLKKLISETGGERQLDSAAFESIKNELDIVTKEIEENMKQKSI
jgi:Trm5-related predicted tRNA methylase